MCVEANMNLDEFTLSIYINKVFNTELAYSRTLANVYLSGKNINEYLLNININ